MDLHRHLAAVSGYVGGGVRFRYGVVLSMRYTLYGLLGLFLIVAVASPLVR